MRAYCEEVTRLFGRRPVIYTGAWWWNPWALLVENHTEGELDWAADYDYYLADYTHVPPTPCVGMGRLIAHQYTSTPVPPISAIPNGGHVDCAHWMGTDDEFTNFIGGTVVTTPAGIYKLDVPPAARGWGAGSATTTKTWTWPASAPARTGVFEMVSQVAAGMVWIWTRLSRSGRRGLTVPGIGVVGLDADLFGKKEIDLNKFQSTWRDMWNNETVRAVLDQWRSNPIPETEWADKHLNITAKDGGWVPLSALVLHMTTTTYSMHGSPINGMWQQAVVDDMLDVLTTLMQGQYIPTVPIYLMANHTWYETYKLDTGWTPGARIASGTLKGLALARVWHEAEDGLIAEAPMATPAATVQELRQYVPAASYQYPIIFSGINFQFFVYSWDRLRAVNMFYPGKTVTTFPALVWCDTKDEMYKSLNFQGAGKPPDLPPDDSELTARVTALEGSVSALRMYLDVQADRITALEGAPADTSRLDALEAWARKFPPFE